MLRSIGTLPRGLSEWLPMGLGASGVSDASPPTHTQAGTTAKPSARIRTYFMLPAC